MQISANSNRREPQFPCLTLSPVAAPLLRMSNGHQQLIERKPSLLAFIAMTSVENDNGSGNQI